MPAHTERAFEAAIEHCLTTQGGYDRRAPADYSEERALFPADACGFLRESQPQKWRALESVRGAQTEATVLEALGKELESNGTPHVLRHGFKCDGKSFPMVCFRLNTCTNPDAAENYSLHLFAVTRRGVFTSVM